MHQLKLHKSGQLAISDIRVRGHPTSISSKQLAGQTGKKQWIAYIWLVRKKAEKLAAFPELSDFVYILIYRYSILQKYMLEVLNVSSNHELAQIHLQMLIINIYS